MRIGFFVWEYPPQLVGGLGAYAEYVTREFVELGHDVSVFTLNTGNLKTREIIKGVEVHRPVIVNASNIFPMFFTTDLKRWGTNSRLFNDIFTYNILSSAKFINEIVGKQGYHYDVVSVHDWLSSVSGILVKNETKIPVVFHAHSTEWGRSGDYGSEIVTYLEEATAKMSDRIITVSYAMREDLVHHGWLESKINVVWNGVDPEVYDPNKCSLNDKEKIRERYGIRGDDTVIFFMGRLTWYKGLRNLIQAMPHVLKEHPKTRLLIIGRGEEQRDLLDMASRLGIEENVICRFEFVPEEERLFHYAASDVCVFPSVYEPFGIVSLEAMAMEKPVVVGAKGVVGFREQVISSGPDQNGVHVNGNDPIDIAWGLNLVLEDPKRAKRWGENGRKRVLQYFTWRKVAEQTIAIYNTLIA